LRGDAGMVSTWNPQGAPAQHTPPAGEDVHLRLVEHVAHVQAAGDVRRRQKDDKGGLVVQALTLGWLRRGRYGEELFAHPVLGPVIFNGGRIVSFRQVVGHFVIWRAPGDCGKTPVKRGFQGEGTTLKVSR